MSAFLAHARKELREQRNLALSILALAVVLTAFGAFAIDNPRHQQFVALVVATASGLGVALALGVDLFGGELRRGSAAFTARTPSGVRTGVATKLLAFIVLVPLSTVAGGLLGLFSSPDRRLFTGLDANHMVANAWVPALALGIATWCLPISCLMPRSAATLPAVVCLFAIGYAPLVLSAWNIHPLLDSWTGAGGTTHTALLLSPVFGLIAGALCYHASSTGRTDLRSRLRTLGLTAALFVPPAASGWIDVADWSVFDPADTRQCIHFVAVDEAGHTAYLRIGRWEDDTEHQAYHVISVDLETSETRHLAGPHADWLLSFHPTSYVDMTRGLRAITIDGGASWIDTRTHEVAIDTKARGDLLLEAQTPPSRVRTSFGTDLRRIGNRLVEFRQGEPTGRSTSLPTRIFALFPRDGFRSMVAANDRYFLVDNDSLTFEEVTGRLTDLEEPELLGRDVAVTLSKRFVLTGGYDEPVTLVDATERRPLPIDPEHLPLSHSIYELSRSDDGTLVLIGSRDSTHQRTRYVRIDLSGEKPLCQSLDIADDAGLLYWDQADRLLVSTDRSRELRWVDFEGESRTVVQLGSER